MEWKRLLWLAGMVLPTVPAFLCVAACPLSTISKNLLLIKSRGTSWNMFCLEAITSYSITLAASSATEAEFHLTFFTLMIYNAAGDVIIHFISLRSSIGNAMTWWLGYSLHTVTLLQHVKLPSLFHAKTTWQHRLVYWKSAFYVIRIPALTQLDSSSKSVSDVLCDFICLFFTWRSFICFNCVSHWLWSFHLVYLGYLFWAVTLHSWGEKADNQALMEYFYALCGLQQTCFWHLEMEIYFQSIAASEFLITHGVFLAF